MATNKKNEIYQALVDIFKENLNNLPVELFERVDMSDAVEYAAEDILDEWFSDNRKDYFLNDMKSTIHDMARWFYLGLFTEY